MNNLPTVKSIVNTPSIFDGYTFEDLVTFGRISAKDATITCVMNAQKKYVEKHGFSISDIDNAKKMADAWIKLEAQVLRKFQEAEEISAVI
jgi:5-bromo-4-chloroindolyl phosphate hydrolysis protein